MSLFKKKKYQSSGSLSSLAIRRFKRNKLALSALIFIASTSLIAILGYLISPDSSPYANNQSLELATKKPGFSVQILNRKLNKAKTDISWFQKMLYGTPKQFESIPIVSYKFDGANIIVEQYTGMTPNDGAIKTYSLVDIAYAMKQNSIIEIIEDEEDSLFFMDLSGNKISLSVIDLQERINTSFIKEKYFILGTDPFGRDLLSQLIIGTRVSLSVGFVAVMISLLIGITLGAMAGYFGGWVDNLIVWFINVVWSIPTLLLVIAITMALGKGYWQVFIAVGLTMWVEVARVVRGQVLSIRQKEFVEAGTALGYSHSRIIFYHILPNVISPLIVISAANFAAAILIEAGLSFLGIGVQPPVPSWGIMIKEHYGYIILDYAYLALLPGLAIMLMVLAFMIVGNALRDALDVKLVDE
ncbi:MAG: ABC transporter permease [Bacteroidales bacterium]|nr:ABC transporter permease [Bacteroidales bacterium]